MSTAATRTLVVYDFDWSFVDQDTDRWVFEVLSTELRRLLQDRKSGGSQCMPDTVGSVRELNESDQTMGDLHDAGFTKDQILDALRELPVHPAQKRAVRGLQERRPDTKFICLSNSNEVYIKTILEKHGLSDLFDTIITNPAAFSTSEPNRLRIGRRVPADGPQHTCKVGCLVNMCKGDELEAWLEANGGRDSWGKVIYVGDGGNDFCPLLRMKEGDWALVRKDMELDGRIREEGQKEGLKVDVKKWGQAWEIDEYFQTL